MRLSSDIFVEGKRLRRCFRCKFFKPIEEFNRRSDRKCGRKFECRSCSKESTRKYSQKRGKEHTRSYDLKRRFGLTIEEYNILLNAQGGNCAICGKPPGSENLCVDHDHRTGKIRGLLHKACNLIIGNAKDSTEILLKAVKYLQRASC